jgi:hypothetical protein
LGSPPKIPILRFIKKEKVPVPKMKCEDKEKTK